MIAKRKILFVDDNAENRLLIKYNLEDYFTIDFTSNGFSAINKCRENIYDLIIMDVHMPELDGIETTKQIREMQNGKYIPIFAITSNMFREQRLKCIDAGMDDYIIKPIHAKALVERINLYFNTTSRYHENK